MSTLTLLETNVSGSLSRRERDVARLVAKGMCNRQISDELYISENTVRGHISRIGGKTGVRGRNQLAVYAMRIGPSPSAVTPKRD